MRNKKYIKKWNAQFFRVYVISVCVICMSQGLIIVLTEMFIIIMSAILMVEEFSCTFFYEVMNERTAKKSRALKFIQNTKFQNSDYVFSGVSVN